MSNVIVAVFQKPNNAVHVMNQLQSLINNTKAEILDACGMMRTDDGSLVMHQMFDRPDRFFITGLWVGGMAGFLGGLVMFGLVPALLAGLAGAIAGLGFSALIAILRDYGINDDFLQKVGTELAIDTSALVILHPPGVTDPVLKLLKQADASIMQTQYTARNEQTLQERLSAMLKRLPEGARQTNANV